MPKPRSRKQRLIDLQRFHVIARLGEKVAETRDPQRRTGHRDDITCCADTASHVASKAFRYLTGLSPFDVQTVELHCIAPSPRIVRVLKARTASGEAVEA